MRSLQSLTVLIIWAAGGCASVGAYKLKSLDTALNEGLPALEKLCQEQRITSACALSGQETPATHKLPFLQSVSAEKEVRLVVQAPKGKGLQYYLISGERIRKLDYETIRGVGQSVELHHLQIFNLNPGVEHKILVAGPNAEMWDIRRFKTLDLKKKRARFALVSCMDDAMADLQKRIWPELLKQNPDVILMLGDNTYADWNGSKGRPITAPEQIWSRYAETRDRLSLFQADPLVPVVAVWDDHDFGKNDGDRTFAFKSEALSVFFAYFAQKQPMNGFRNGPGVASWWSAFGSQFVFLDDRSFRSPNKVELPDETHFGLEQEKWLMEGLAEASTPVFLISGDQFFGGYHNFESYEGSHPRRFKKQLDEWRAVKAPMIFLSGDRHLTEIIKVSAEHLGYPTFEITSSGIHAKVFAEAFKNSPSPMQLAGRAGENNYSIVEIMEASKGRVQLDVKSFGPGTKLLYQKTLMVKR